MKNFKYSILKDFILVIRQSDGPAIWRAERLGTARGAVPAKEPACRAGQLPDASTGQSRVLGMVL